MANQEPDKIGNLLQVRVEATGPRQPKSSTLSPMGYGISLAESPQTESRAAFSKAIHLLARLKPQLQLLSLDKDASHQLILDWYRGLSMYSIGVINEAVIRLANSKSWPDYHELKALCRWVQSQVSDHKGYAPYGDGGPPVLTRAEVAKEAAAHGLSICGETLKTISDKRNG